MTIVLQIHQAFQSYDSLPTVKSETIILDLNSALLKSSIYFSFKSYFKLFFFQQEKLHFLNIFLFFDALG